MAVSTYIVNISINNIVNSSSKSVYIPILKKSSRKFNIIIFIYIMLRLRFISIYVEEIDSCIKILSTSKNMPNKIMVVNHKQSLIY